MQLSLVLAALLCFTTWVTFTNATHGSERNCCLQWSTTKVPVNRIVNYTIQPEGVCPIKAVLLETRRRNKLCSDPDSEWAKRAMAKVDKDRTSSLEVGQKQEGSTDDMTPAATVTSKKGSKRRGRNRRRKNHRRGRKGQKKRA
ncbi:eotaxin-like isoform X1 [Stegastes partitus]|uniref:Eotaxin-like n=1 Tax=Stegastes partitus TaxID=144197 RepID=A0A3B4ZGG4_9TELE|nr:PREDICTED: eotaxin-like isoform X1 [Stegastes partitus]